MANAFAHDVPAIVRDQHAAPLGLGDPPDEVGGEVAND